MSRTVFRNVAAGLCAIGVVGAITLRASFHPTSPNLHPPSPNAPQVDPAPLYRLHCQMCHGANGKAPMPEMAFVDRKWTHGTSSAQMAKIIAEGVKGTPMMPFKNKLKPEQITALAKLVRSFDKRLKPEKQ
ncbi:MAG: cytochrome c [Acidimicrobiia bacterium]|nr:cytochrome c [Acidimicrobiia bacterium]